MKTLSLIYWCRAGLGIAAAIVCEALNLQSLLSGLSLVMLVHMLSYYIFKWKFVARLESPSKVFTTGIGAYFLTWLVTWVLMYTIL